MSYKKIFGLFSLVAVALSFAVIPAFAQVATDTGSSTPVTTTPSSVVKKTIDGTCVATAIGTRDTALETAIDTYNNAIKQALETRKGALQSAWVLSTAKERNTAVKTAWKEFNTARLSAAKTLRSAKAEAWKQFTTDTKSCGPRAGALEEGHRWYDNAL